MQESILIAKQGCTVTASSLWKASEWENIPEDTA